MSQTRPISLWDATALEKDVDRPFVPNGRVDVAIVGGGFTGLSTALHCAERGLSAHVLEAECIGFGGSGRNVGLVNAAAWLPPASIRKKLGSTYGPRFLDRFCKAPATVFELIEKHQIRCEARRNGTVHAARSRRGLRDLEGRHVEWVRMGEPVDFLDRCAVGDLIGTEAYMGGLLDHRAGTINPMGYCRGLARVAESLGATISTGVRATGLSREGDEWRVETDQGPVLAKYIVLATNAYTDDLWPGLAKVFTTIHYLQFVTAPLGPEAAHILPRRQGLWDTGPIMFNFRRDDADRLLFGTMGRVIGSKDRGLTRRWAARQIARVFPELGTVDFEQAWHGRIAMTPSHLPSVHQLAEGLWTPIGYNGRGITTGTIFGQAMAEILTGADPMELPLPVTDPKVVRAGTITSRIYDLAFTANQLWRSI